MSFVCSSTEMTKSISFQVILNVIENPRVVSALMMEKTPSGGKMYPASRGAKKVAAVTKEDIVARGRTSTV